MNHISRLERRTLIVLPGCVAIVVIATRCARGALNVRRHAFDSRSRDDPVTSIAGFARE